MGATMASQELPVTALWTSESSRNDATYVAPITGPMYQLFIFFMVTDPKTTVRSKSGQVLVVFLVAVMEMILRLNEVVYAPFYALFLVGPASLVIDTWLRSKSLPAPPVGLRPTYGP